MTDRPTNRPTDLDPLLPFRDALPPDQWHTLVVLWRQTSDGRRGRAGLKTLAKRARESAGLDEPRFRLALMGLAKQGLLILEDRSGFPPGLLRYRLRIHADGGNQDRKNTVGTEGG